MFIAPLLKSHHRVEHAFRLVHFVHLLLFGEERGEEGGGRGGEVGLEKERLSTHAFHSHFLPFEPLHRALYLVSLQNLD